MTPITAFYGGLLGVVFLYFSLLVVKQRRNQKVSLGDGGDQRLQSVIRAHANFSEYVPLALVLMLITELNNVNHLFVHAIGLSLVIGRVLHGYGLRHHTGASWQRVWGILLTFISLILSSVLCVIMLYL